ncbi:MAG: helix-turn-helix domain-containing protein [Peptostreptococcaceae bacterium]|nr:helix-turn-helix domain-containing protein [Peptostreptococcaceae bacterium]
MNSRKILNKTDRKQIFFNINQVAKAIGVVPATIRNWEKAGLFVAKRRKNNNYRIFDFDDIEMLKKIKSYSIDENMNGSLIKKLLAQDLTASKPQDPKYPKAVYYAKLKECREKRAYTLDEVSEMTGVSASYLSKIESGNSNVSLDILQKLASFYGESILSFFKTGRTEGYEVTRNNRGIPWESNLDGVYVTSLAHLQNTTMIPTLFTVDPGCGDFVAHTHSSGQEFIYILSGKIKVILDESDTHILRKNDSIHFASTRMHEWHNFGKVTAQFLWIHSSL